MSDNDLPGSFDLSRRTAALRQMVWAIELMRMGFYDCAITLAGAAEGMMPDNEHGLHRKIIEAGIPDELLDDPEYGSLVTDRTATGSGTAIEIG